MIAGKQASDQNAVVSNKPEKAMLVTRRDARRIIAAEYGPEFRFRITNRTTIGVRTVLEVELGKPTLCWRSIGSGVDSAVSMGRLGSDLLIDWQWEPSSSASPRR